MTRTSRPIAPAIVGRWSSAAWARKADGADSTGRTAVSKAATSSPGINMPRLPGKPNRAISAVTSSGPTAMPILPPVEKMDTPVALLVARDGGGGAVALGVVRGHAEAGDHDQREHGGIRGREPDQADADGG